MDPEKKKPKTDAEILEEAHAYRANLSKYDLHKGERWWSRLLTMVEERDAEIAALLQARAKRFRAQAFRWFSGVRSRG
jgi:hypothetical protein